MTSGTPAQVGVAAWLDDQGRLVRLEGFGNGGTVMPGRAIPDSWQPLYPSAALTHRVEQLEAALGLISEGPPSSLENGGVAGWVAEIARAALKEGAQ